MALCPGRVLRKRVKALPECWKNTGEIKKRIVMEGEALDVLWIGDWRTAYVFTWTNELFSQNSPYSKWKVDFLSMIFCYQTSFIINKSKKVNATMNVIIFFLLLSESGVFFFINFCLTRKHQIFFICILAKKGGFWRKASMSEPNVSRIQSTYWSKFDILPRW